MHIESFAKHILEVLYKEAMLGNCLHRKYAAAIVRDGMIVSINHARTINGKDCTRCVRYEKIKEYGKISEFFEVCNVVHAEVCAILECDRRKLPESDLFLLGLDTIDNSVYSSAFPCENCLKVIKFVGIKHLCIFTSKTEYAVYEVEKI